MAPATDDNINAKPTQKLRNRISTSLVPGAAYQNGTALSHSFPLARFPRLFSLR